MAGAKLAKTQNNGYTGKVQTYHVAAGHSGLLAIGDFVLLTGTAHTDGTAQVDDCAAGELITGVIVGFKPNLASLETKGLAGSVAGFVYVNTDPYALWEIEIGTTALAVTSVGLNADITATIATTSGNLVFSNMVLDGASSPSTASQQLRIVGLIPGEVGTTLGAVGQKALVRFNESTEKGTVGV